jgi:hypothetical protein
MHRLSFLAVLALGLLSAVDGSTCSAKPLDSSLPTSVNAGWPAGMGRYCPQRWGIVAVDSSNSTDHPQEILALLYFTNDPALQYARRSWVPPRAVRRSWMPIRFPAFAADVGMAELVSLRLDKSSGAEVAVRDSGGLMRPSIYLAVTHSKTITGVISNRADSRVLKKEVADVIVAMKESAHLPRRRASKLHCDFLPPTAESLQSLAHLVIAGDQLASDAAGMSAVRQWLMEGGRLWIMLDQVDPATVELLLGDTFDCQVVDRVGLTRVELNRVDPKLVGSAESPAEFEEPVELVRVITANQNVLYSVNGWPAAFSRPVGSGYVLFTTLGPRGWIRTRTARDPRLINPTYPSDYIASDALGKLGGRFFPRSQAPILAPERFSPALSRQIGYRIVERNWIVAILGMFCLVLLLVGAWLRRGEQLEKMVWIGPALAAITAVFLIAIGTRSRHEVPSTVAMAQIAHIESGIEELRITGVTAIFNQNEYNREIGSKRGGVLLPDMTGLGGKTRRMTWTDLDAWHWENLSLPSGIRMATFRTKAESHQTIEARGSFGPTGFTGTIQAGPFTEVSDAIIAMPSHRNLAVNIDPDGGFSAGPDDVLAPGHFINRALLTDRQRHRAEMHRQSLDVGGPVSYPTRPMLLAWARPLDLGFVISEGAKQVGWALLPIPLKVDPVPADTEVVIPSTFVDFRQVAGLDERISSAYGNYRREWMVQRRASRIWLRFQIPKEVLPLTIKRATLKLKINAPSWSAHICGVSDMREVPLQTLSGPVGAFQVPIHEPKALTLDDDGGLLLGIVVDQDKGGDLAAADGTRNRGAPWNMESVQLEVSGVTLPPQD